MAFMQKIRISGALAMESGPSVGDIYGVNWLRLFLHQHLSMALMQKGRISVALAMEPGRQLKKNLLSRQWKIDNATLNNIYHYIFLMPHFRWYKLYTFGYSRDV